MTAPFPRPHGEPLSAGESSPLQMGAKAALIIGLGFLGIWTLWTFLPALAWAGIFAIALWPSYERACRRWPPKKHNILLPAGFTAAIALVFIVPLALLAVQLGRELHSLVEFVMAVQRDGIPAPEFLGRLPFGGAELQSWWNDNLTDPAGAADLLHRVNRGDFVSYSRHLGSQLVHRLILFAFTILTLFFLFRDGTHLRDQMLRVSQRTFGARGERLGRQIIASVHGTVDGLVLVGLAEGVLLGVAYAIIGVPHPTLLGAMTAVAAMVPMGAPLVFGIAAVIVLVQKSAALAIGLFCFGVAVTFVADHFVRPVLIGGSTRLPFLWVLLGILGGVESWGLLGLFLGPAIMAALIMLWREWAGSDTIDTIG